MEDESDSRLLPSAASATDTLLRLLPTCDLKIRHRPVDDTSPRSCSHGATGGVSRIPLTLLVKLVFLMMRGIQYCFS